MNPFTVLLVYPATLADGSPLFYLANAIFANDLPQALSKARREAFYAQPTFARRGRTVQDFKVVVALEGHVKPVYYSGDAS